MFRDVSHLSEKKAFSFEMHKNPKINSQKFHKTIFETIDKIEKICFWGAEKARAIMKRRQKLEGLFVQELGNERTMVAQFLYNSN